MLFIVCFQRFKQGLSTAWNLRASMDMAYHKSNHIVFFWTWIFLVTVGNNGNYNEIILVFVSFNGQFLYIRYLSMEIITFKTAV